MDLPPRLHARGRTRLIVVDDDQTPCAIVPSPSHEAGMRWRRSRSGSGRPPQGRDPTWNTRHRPGNQRPQDAAGGCEIAGRTRLLLAVARCGGYPARVSTSPCPSRSALTSLSCALLHHDARRRGAAGPEGSVLCPQDRRQRARRARGRPVSSSPARPGPATTHRRRAARRSPPRGTLRRMPAVIGVSFAPRRPQRMHAPRRRAAAMLTIALLSTPPERQEPMRTSARSCRATRIDEGSRTFVTSRASDGRPCRRVVGENRPLPVARERFALAIDDHRVRGGSRSMSLKNVCLVWSTIPSRRKSWTAAGSRSGRNPWQNPQRLDLAGEGNGSVPRTPTAASHRTDPATASDVGPASQSAKAQIPLNRVTQSMPHSAYTARTTSVSVSVSNRCPSAASSAASSRKL